MNAVGEARLLLTAREAAEARLVPATRIFNFQGTFLSFF